MVSRDTNFIEGGIAVIKTLRKRKRGYTVEEIREKIESKDIFPHSSRSYGPLIQKAVRTGILKETEEERVATSCRNRQKLSPVYAR